MRFYFTNEHIEFLRSGYQQMRIQALTASFNKNFGTKKTEGSIKAALKNRKIVCGRKPGFAKGERFHKYTRDQAEFIKKGYTRMPLAELKEAFNSAFNVEMSESQIRAFTKNHKISSGRTGRFEKGNVPFNAGTKGVMKRNSGTFTKGNVPGNVRPVGAERVCKKDGYVLVKVVQKNPWTGAKTRFMVKHVISWEKHHGPVPEGKILCFIDGNVKNCDIDNLRLISRSDHLQFNRSGFGDLPAEIRPVAITLAQVQAKIYEVSKRDNSRQGDNT